MKIVTLAVSFGLLLSASAEATTTYNVVSDFGPYNPIGPWGYYQLVDSGTNSGCTSSYPLGCRVLFSTSVYTPYYSDNSAYRSIKYWSMNDVFQNGVGAILYGQVNSSAGAYFDLVTNSVVVPQYGTLVMDPRATNYGVAVCFAAPTAGTNTYTFAGSFEILDTSYAGGSHYTNIGVFQNTNTNLTSSFLGTTTLSSSSPGSNASQSPATPGTVVSFNKSLSLAQYSEVCFDVVPVNGGSNDSTGLTLTVTGP